jgi:hypothetical protein
VSLNSPPNCEIKDAFFRSPIKFNGSSSFKKIQVRRMSAFCEDENVLNCFAFGGDIAMHFLNIVMH